jgi:DUF971 family protein
MQPVDMQVVGEELAVKWPDGGESYIRLEFLRRCCPCAGCKGEMDIMGNLYKDPERPLTAGACVLKRLTPVGNYAVNLHWGDGHSAGFYAYAYLRKIAAAAEAPGQ